MATSDTPASPVTDDDKAPLSTRPDRRRQILEATLGQVAIHGLLNTTMSKISSAAGASAGIVYHYFESKDDLLETLFVTTFQDMTTAVCADLDLTQPALQRITGLWLRKYDYHRSHPAETDFMEQYKNSPLFTPKTAETMNTINEPLITMIEQDKAHGTVANLPLVTINTMTLGVALMAAKDVRSYGVALDGEELNAIANRCARSVLA